MALALKIVKVKRLIDMEYFFGYRPSYEMYSNPKTGIKVTGFVDVYNNKIEYKIKDKGFWEMYFCLSELVNRMVELGIEVERLEPNFFEVEDIDD